MLPIIEQETVIQFSRDGKEAVIDTSDSTMITKLEKLRSKSDHYRLVEIHMANGEECGRRYSLDDKGLISLRSKRMTPDISDEQRQERAERMRNLRS